MNKLLGVIAVVASTLAVSSIAVADHGYYGRGYGGGEGHHHHHHHGHRHGYGRPNYYPPQVIYYAPQPPVQMYAPPPPVYYAPPPPVQHYREQRYDQRSPTGLAGGVVGGVMGYQFGEGDPVVTGLGAAAGAALGNRW